MRKYEPTWNNYIVTPREGVNKRVSECFTHCAHVVSRVLQNSTKHSFTYTGSHITKDNGIYTIRFMHDGEVLLKHHS